MDGDGKSKYGALAQLVARNVRNVEVRGSNPLCSTRRPENFFSGLFLSNSALRVRQKKFQAGVGFAAETVGYR